MGFLGKISVASAILLLAGAQAEAKTPSLKDALRSCASIPGPTERLACFDAVAQSQDRGKGKGKGAPAATDAVVTASAPPAVAAPTSVSKPAPVTATDQRTASRERREQVRQGYDATVLRAWKNAAGDDFIALTNGEIWKSQARDSGRPIKDGEQVALSPGAVGSWFMEFKTQKRPAIRVGLLE